MWWEDLAWFVYDVGSVDERPQYLGDIWVLRDSIERVFENGKSTIFWGIATLQRLVSLGIGRA